MKILFYSSCSNVFNGNTYHHTYFPECRTQLEQFISSHKDSEIYIFTTRPALFLIDFQNQNDFLKASQVHYKLFSEDTDFNTFAEQIISVEPDFACALSFWFPPFDWLSLNDSLIAEKLRNNGIETIANSVETQKICFDKRETRFFLEKNGFNFAPSFFIQKELFWAERGIHEIKRNYYKDEIMNRLSKAVYPLIIKDTTGLSSFGMEVVKTFGEARHFLESKKFNSDRLVESFIKGVQFGVEIYGKDGNYYVSGPFMFSVNQYGITSPKQSVKAGPVNNPFYKTDELFSEMKRLASLLKVSGSIQVDLVFDGNKWFILEINPRISGLTGCTFSSLNTNIFELFFDTEKVFSGKQKAVLDLKFPVLAAENLEKLKNYKKSLFVMQTLNEEARQNREAGFCEAVFGGTDEISELNAILEEINDNFSDFAEKEFIEKARQVLSNCSLQTRL